MCVYANVDVIDWETHANGLMRTILDGHEHDKKDIAISDGESASSDSDDSDSDSENDIDACAQVNVHVLKAWLSQTHAVDPITRYRLRKLVLLYESK